MKLEVLKLYDHENNFHTFFLKKDKDINFIMIEIKDRDEVATVIYVDNSIQICDSDVNHKRTTESRDRIYFLTTNEEYQDFTLRDCHYDLYRYLQDMDTNIETIQFHIVAEKWRTLTLDSQTYQVSSLGRIKIDNELIEPQVSESGYYIVPKKQGVVFVHLLVAMAFLGKTKDDQLTIDHIDNNRRNNAVKNLELVTADENNRRAIAKRKKRYNAKEEKTLERIKKFDATFSIQGYDKTFDTFKSAFHFYKKNINPHSKQTLFSFYTNVFQAIKNNVKFAHTLWAIYEK